jgi:hypothetical protein
MPQMKVWPFMARTMVEESHGVKPLLGARGGRSAGKTSNAAAAYLKTGEPAVGRIKPATKTARSSDCGG